MKVVKTIKTIILVVLVVLSVYQASLLWSNELEAGDGIVFTGNQNDYNVSSIEDEIYLLTPNKLGVYLERESKEFTIIKRTNAYYDNLYKESSEALIESLKFGELFSRGVKMEALFDSRSIFYTLHKDIPKEVFVDVFGVDKDMLVGMDLITSFGVILSPNADSYAFAYLINDLEEVNVYQIKNDKTGIIVSNLNYYIDQILVNEKLPVYKSSVFDAYLDPISKHVLFPVTDNQLSYTKEIYFYIPFHNIDGIIHGALEDFVNGFELGAKWEIKRDHEVIFGTEKKKISYNDEGVFHYKVFGETFTESLGLAESYQLATSFIEKDKQISKQEYYLKNYTQTEKGYIFYYGYSYVDFPLVLDSVYAKSLGVVEPMTIEIEGNQVMDYKRLMINMEDVGPGDKIFNSEYREMLDYFKEEQIIDKPIEDVFLGYYWNDVDRAQMKWIIEYDHVYYSVGL